MVTGWALRYMVVLVEENIWLFPTVEEDKTFIV